MPDVAKAQTRFCMSPAVPAEQKFAHTTHDLRDKSPRAARRGRFLPVLATSSLSAILKLQHEKSHFTLSDSEHTEPS